MTFNINDVVKAYIQLRDRKASIKAEAEAQTNAITDKMLRLEAWLKQQADQLGTTQHKTPSGTAYFKTEDFSTVADWDAVLQYVKENEAFHLLEKRVNKLAVRSHLGEHKALPPGVNYGTRLVMGVRKPTSSTDDILGGENAEDTKDA